MRVLIGLGLHLSSVIGLGAALPPKTTAPATAVEWGAWRGDGSGVSQDGRNVALSWGVNHNVRWKTAIPGYGWSCPVVAGDKVFLTSAVFESQAAPLRQGPPSGVEAPDASIKRQVICLGRSTGKILWNQTAAEVRPEHGNHPSNTWATETPVVDDSRVYAFFGNVGVFCYDFSGKLMWSANLGSRKTFGNWGTSSSPAFDGERIFLQCDSNDKSFLIALDKKTGKERWHVPREERSTWSTPIVWNNLKRAELVCMGSSFIRAYDPSNGRELWRLASENSMGRSGGPGRDGPPGPPPKSAPKSESTGGKGGPPPRGGGSGKAGSGGCKSSPVATRDMLYVGMSSRKPGQEFGPLWAIKPGATGDISLREGQTSSSHIAWYRDDAGPHFNSPLVAGDFLYVFPAHDREGLECLDARTGDTLYTHPLEGSRGFKSSACFVDGKIFNTDEAGTTFVIEAGSQFKLLHKNALDEMTWSSPAIAGGAVFLRTVSKLYCLAAGGAANTPQASLLPSKPTH
ncbi:MAG TPA: PQQ-binding-like beta-propeller repeat protein [Verrucomicrobiaceae bacterium]